jgi:phytoene desaturase
MNKKNKNAIIIGSGVAGLSSAIRLACMGYRVDVYEASSMPGGKISQITENGFRWDTGPSLFTLPHLLDELFELAGKNPSDYYNYSKLNIITRYFFSDETVFDAYQDVNQLVHEFAAKFGEDVSKMRNFFADVEDTYNFTEPLFLQNPIKDFPKHLEGSLWQNIKHFMRMNAFATMHKTNKKYFKNQKTIQIFNRYATYNGSDPYRAPGTLNVIAHLEHQLGAFFLKGGMYTLADSLYKLALECGVSFHFNTKVDGIVIENKTAQGIIVNGGKVLSDIVVSNADVSKVYSNLMPEIKKPALYLNQEKSTSALVFYWGIKKVFNQTELHNIFFSEDYQNEFKILADGKVCDDPTVYLYVSSKENQDDAPVGCENWFVMINVPYNSGQNWNEITARSRKNILNKLSRQLKEDIEPLIVAEHTLDPVLLEQKTSSDKGALYGNSSNNMFSAFLRHPNKVSGLKNLYFASGSGHPGGGIPLCILSSKIVAQHIQHDQFEQ